MGMALGLDATRHRGIYLPGVSNTMTVVDKDSPSGMESL